MFVFKYTIFPIPLFGQMVDIMREQTTLFSGINLIPLKVNSIDDLLHKQIIMNIFVSIPFGFSIPYIVKRVRIILWGVVFGVGIEILQLIISLIIGFSYRYTDINDVILNFVGVIIGYSIFRIFSLLFIRVTSWLNIEYNALLKYIYTVAQKNINKTENI